MRNNRFGHLALAAVVAAALGGCVTLPPNQPRSPQDPWESWNRGVYKFNDALDRHIVKPVAKGYVRVIPKAARTGINNFFANLKTPTVMINDALQGKFLAAANDLGRFLLNTTVGIGGLLDPASAAGLDRNEADFGLTFGHWGVHPGPFVELPILGPSSVRELPGLVLETYTDPRHYIKNSYVKYGLYVVNAIDKRASLLPLDQTLKNVYDPYAFIRDAYLARRAYLATGKSPHEDEPLIDPEADEPGNAPAHPSAPPPAEPGAPPVPHTAEPPGAAEPSEAAPPSGSAASRDTLDMRDAEEMPDGADDRGKPDATPLEVDLSGSADRPPESAPEVPVL